MPRVDIRRAQRISVHEVGDAPVKVGRLNDNDLVLRNIHVSRHHCVIERHEGRVRVRDLDSQSGTYVNGERITESPLYAGDRISVGPFDLVMRAAPEDVDFISRNAALDAALSHVSIDDSTGLPVEGPAALVDDLTKQLEAERKQHRKAAAQVASLLQQVDDLQMQMAQSERAGLLQDDLPLPDQERVTELEQALIDAQQRAIDAERREIERIASLQAQLDQQRQEALDAQERADQAARELDALRRETMPSSAAEQIAEMQGLLDIERRRARTAEESIEQLTAGLDQARRLSEDAARASELERMLEIERGRVDEAARRASEFEARLADLQLRCDELDLAARQAVEMQSQLDDARDQAQSAASRADDAESQLHAQIEELRRQREADLERQAELHQELESAQSLLREARMASESVSTDRHSALKQLEDAESALADWRTRGETAERSLETEKAHASDLNRALEEAWHKIDEATAQARTLESRVEELESTSRQNAEQAAETLAKHLADIERVTQAEADLRRQLEDTYAAREATQRELGETRERLETAEASLRHSLARADELEKASVEMRDRVTAAEQALKAHAEQAAAEIASRDQRLADLRSSEENYKQRLNNLEATKFAASQKAERALGTLNLLQGQIRSLDDAAAKVTDLQSRLARIEEAWVAADETLESAEEGDQAQLAAAVEQRQRIVAELDALNKARDQAVMSLRESALRLRSIAEREAPAVPGTAQPQPLSVGAGPSGAGRKWFKRDKS